VNRLPTEDKLAIHELLARSAWAYDEAQFAVLEACFTEDARMGLQIAAGDPIGPYEGRAAILDLIRGAMAAQNDQRRHVISNVFFERTDTQSAVVVSTLTLFATVGEQISVISAGVYRDTVVREPDGWRFRERVLTLDKGY
jgi:3-phenylpropionate/cinnamic acid dioxygenase small subunit